MTDLDYGHELWERILLLCGHVIRYKPEVSVRGDERENSFGLPSLEADARVEAHIVQESGVLQVEKNLNNWPSCFSLQNRTEL